MGKPDLDAVHEAVPCALEDGEVVMVSWVVEDGLQCSGGHIQKVNPGLVSSVLEKSGVESVERDNRQASLKRSVQRGSLWSIVPDK